MRDVLLIIVLITLISFGFYIMNKMGEFIDESRSYQQIKKKLIKSSSVKMSGNTPFIEIYKEIEKFKNSHDDFQIILKDEKSNMD